MTKFKKGYKFRHLAAGVEIIEQEDNLLLAKIKPDFSMAYYDISRIQLDNYGNEHFYPSPQANGLIENAPGDVKVPKTLEAMKLEFDKLVADKVRQGEMKKKATAEALEKERAAALKTQKLWDASKIQREAREQVKQLILDAGSNMDKLSDSKKLHGLLMRIAAAELIIQTLNSK